MVHMYIVKNTTIYVCTINWLLLFDNTTGMTHLKIITKELLENYIRQWVLALQRCCSGCSNLETSTRNLASLK